MRKFLQWHVLTWAVSLVMITAAVALSHQWEDGPVARWLVFTVDPLNGADQLVRMRANGSGAEVIEDNFVMLSTPQWSPDGAWIAYFGAGRTMQRRSFANNYYPGVYLIRPDGHDRRLVVRFESNRMLHQEVRWSADGRRLIFALNDFDRGTFRYYRVQADGTGLQEWQAGELWLEGEWIDVASAASSASMADQGDFQHYWDSMLRLSGAMLPSRRWAYQGQGGDLAPGLYRRAMTPEKLVDWSQEPELLAATDNPAVSVVAAPDGRAVWFSTAPSPTQTALGNAIHGGDLYRYDLATGALDHLLGDDTGWFQLGWSSDQRWLTVQHMDGNQTALYLLDPADTATVNTLSDLHRVTPRGFRGQGFDWSPPVELSFQWWVLFAAGIAGLLGGCGLWARALLRLRRTVGTLRLPVMQLVLADAGMMRRVQYA